MNDDDDDDDDDDDGGGGGGGGDDVVFFRIQAGRTCAMRLYCLSIQVLLHRIAQPKRCTRPTRARSTRIHTHSAH